MVMVCIGTLMMASGCGSDLREVGGSCSYHADCMERCVTGRHFPGGMCTLSCDHASDCPGATMCIDRRDGICALTCYEDRDCPGGYKCNRESRHGEGGREYVCIGD